MNIHVCILSTTIVVVVVTKTLTYRFCFTHSRYSPLNFSAIHLFYANCNVFVGLSTLMHGGKCAITNILVQGDAEKPTITQIYTVFM